MLFILLTGLHGLVHVLGFLTAFRLADFEALMQPISRPMGLAWLLAVLLFIAAAVQYARSRALWWPVAMAAVMVSQVLVITFWQDARFATIPNVIILGVAVVAAAGYSFEKRVSREVETVLSKGDGAEPDIMTAELLAGLPAPVERWLRHSGILGKERIRIVRLKQEALMKLKPEAENWTPAIAEQYFATCEPAFVWKVRMQMMPFVHVVGRDKFEEGRGEMLIKMLSLVPVANSKGSDKVDTGTLQRFLGEIVWFPSAALSPFISWEETGEHSARATMAYRGTTDSGEFHFDEHGDVLKYSARRYMGDEAGAERRDWIITVQETRSMHGIRIPTRMEATWKLADGDWTWLRLRITDIDYNLPKPYVQGHRPH